VRSRGTGGSSALFFFGALPFPSLPLRPSPSSCRDNQLAASGSVGTLYSSSVVRGRALASILIVMSPGNVPGGNDFASFFCDQNVHLRQKRKETTTMTRTQGMTVIFVGRLGGMPPPRPGSAVSHSSGKVPDRVSMSGGVNQKNVQN